MEYDLYVLFSEHDEEKVNNFLSVLQENNPKLKFFSKKISSSGNADEEKDGLVENEKGNTVFKDWSEETEKDMLRTKKIVSFFSPQFLSNPNCVDHHNLAICASRKWNKNFLAPVYLETIPYVPVYLTLIQWIDCRAKVTKIRL